MTSAEDKINNLEAAMTRMQEDAARTQTAMDRILEDNAAMRDQVRKDSKYAQASPSVGNYKLSVPILDKEAPANMALFNLWTQQASLRYSLANLPPRASVQMVSLASTTALPSEVKVETTLDRMDPSVMNAETTVDIKEALSSHDIHLSAPVPLGLLAYFCV